MRINLALLFLGALFVGCGGADAYEVEYVADGRAQSVEVSFLLPRGIDIESDTTFVPGDSLFTRGDTTFVVDPALPWRYVFDADEGQTLYLRVRNLTDRNHVSSIIHVDGDFRASDGSGEPHGVAEVRDTL